MTRFSGVAPYWDGVHSIVAGLISLLALSLIGIGVLVASGVLPPIWITTAPGVYIVLISGATAFLAFYRLRRPDKSSKPAVRPSFEPTDEEDQYRTGLKNFGPGPAIYLQAKISGPGSTDPMILRPFERPLHLSEGEMFDITLDSPPEEPSLSDLMGEADDNEELIFEFTYLSDDGRREPSYFDMGSRRDDATVLDELNSDNPRRMKVGEIRRNSGQLLE